MSADGGRRDGGEVVPMRSRRRRPGAPASAVSGVTEEQAARLLRAYYHSYSRGQDIEPSPLQVEAMIDALVLTFELRLVLA